MLIDILRQLSQLDNLTACFLLFLMIIWFGHVTRCDLSVSVLDLLSIRDYYSLVNLLCTDFPYELLQKTAKIVLIDDAHDCLISFTDFLYAFQVQLYFNGKLSRWAIQVSYIGTANHIAIPAY